MKIKKVEMSYEEVTALPKRKHQKPLKPTLLFRLLQKAVSEPELKKVGFTYEKVGMEKLSGKEPVLVLMNHSCSLDLKIATHILYPKPFNIVCTSDGFVGKEWLMRNLGCIPTQKFVTDVTLIKDMIYCLKKRKCSVLMYPEASYSFDGTATPLPQSLGKCIKTLKVPVVMIRTYGAFQRDPLYNNLQLRKVKVTAKEELLLTAKDVEEKSAAEIQKLLQEVFSFDNFAWQQENQVAVTEDFRADDLNRVLYKCPHCLTEGKMVGKGTTITCHHCHATYELTKFGSLRALDRETKFTHVPDWFRWERACVREEIIAGTYRLQADVDICMMVDRNAIYHVGHGVLMHDRNGFVLDGCDGKLHYEQKPTASYSLYSDYFWYELGDMICIGTNDTLYYCFPKGEGDVVAKTRLAAEELYQLYKNKELPKKD